MAFIYEKIREEDKEWVDFGRFKGMRNEPYAIGVSSRWTLDKDAEMALVFAGSQGRIPEDDYVINACGFYYKGAYINFTIRQIKTEKSLTQQNSIKWFHPCFEFTNEVEHEQQIIVNAIKEALKIYSQYSKYEKYDAVFDF